MSIIPVDDEYLRFLLGNKLQNESQKYSHYNYRDAVHKMSEFLKKKSKGSVGVVYGLRRTGKTVALYHIAAKYIKAGWNVAYATFNYNQHDFNAVLRAIHKLTDEGYELILLDEISRCYGFLNSAMELSDRVNGKVIIAGTDSMMVRWAMNDALFGRTCVADTTNMSFGEYKRIFPGKSIENFVRDGGVLWDFEPESVEQYLRTSVIENIKNSVSFLESDQHVIDRRIFSVLDSETLYRLLVAVCELNTEAAVLKNLENRWEEPIAWKLTQAHTDVNGLINDEGLQKVKNGLLEYFVAFPREEFDKNTMTVLIQRLLELRFLTEATEHSYDMVFDVLVISQPFIRRDFVRRILSVVAQEKIDSFTYTMDKLESTCDGYVLEDICYMEARKRYFDKHAVQSNVFKFRGSGSEEIDVCIYRAELKKLSLIEVKYSDKIVKQGVDSLIGQDRWLVDENVVGFLKQKYSPAELTKTVLYRGQTEEPSEAGTVRWVNVEDWLLGKVEV